MSAPVDVGGGDVGVELDSARVEADMVATMPATAKTNGTRRAHNDDRATIQVRAGELARIVPEAIDAVAGGDPNLYQRDGRLVTIAIEPDQPEPVGADDDFDVKRRGSSLSLRPGTPRIAEVPASELGVRLARVARWEKWIEETKTKPGGFVPIDPPLRVVGMVLDATDRRRTRWLRGIIEAPAMRPDGTIIEREGYDAATGYVLRPSCEFPPVPKRPTRAQAREAMRRIWITMFADFPYAGLGESDAVTDPDRSQRYVKACDNPGAFVSLAALFTLAAAPAIGGARPAFVNEASTQGSGKSLQNSAVSMVATGRAASVATFPSSRGGEPNEEELEKVLASYAIAGVPIVCFDNVRGQIGGASLERAVTAEGSISLRVLGESKQRTLPWDATIMINGNNATMSDDMMQRSLVSRLESDREDPRKRPSTDYLYPNLLAVLRERRAALLVDVLTVLRAFVNASEADKEQSRKDAGSIGSFEAWSALVPAAICFAGGPSVVKARPDVGDMGQDSESEAHAILMSQWRWSEQIKAGDIIKRLFENEHEQRTGATPDGNDELRGAVRLLTNCADNARPNPQSFGIKLTKLRSKWRDGRKIEGMKDAKTKLMHWRVVEEKRPSSKQQPNAPPVPVAPTTPSSTATPTSTSSMPRPSSSDDYDPAEDFRHESPEVNDDFDPATFTAEDEGR